LAARARREGRKSVMHIVHIHVHVKPEFVEAFKQVTIENARESIQEPGIARFDLIQQGDDPTHFVLVEVYRTPAAPALHKATAHYKTWRDIVEGMASEPRVRVIYSNIFPPDKDW
jgi:autoinducer 2-degrading protein